MNFFTPEFLDLHNETEQLTRQAKVSFFKVEHLDIIYQTAVINGYNTSLESCTCADFCLREKPCKHMYRLANELKLFSFKKERSRRLIANFKNGYANNWKFIVRPCNYSNLDIIEQMLLAPKEKRGKNSKKIPTLTQGKIYNFERGEVFYDNDAAYSEEWGIALEKINVALRIDSATNSSAFREVVLKEDKFVNVLLPIYGIVNFSVYKPNPEHSKMEKIESYSCRQDEFVYLLKDGIFADLNGEYQRII